ncbi:hypothetical protein EDB19DRAFT_2021466 [Suillus lakei]|nr:hypothetical protein EDB19DRAFT_2021466 [Suillus lakei]
MLNCKLSLDAEDLNDGWGPSQYNNEKGMKFSVLFTPLQPLDPKCQKNVKLTTTTKIVYVHEDMSMKDMITKVFENIKRCDLLGTSWLYASCELEGSDSLSFTSTVYQSQNKDVSLDNEDDYAELCTRVQDARKAEVALKLLEQKVYPLLVLSIWLTELLKIEVATGDYSTEDEQDEEDNKNPQKKQKQHVLSTEEIAQDQHIVNLQNKYHCKDQACPYDLCYPLGPTAKHVHLIHKHLQTWRLIHLELILSILQA